MNLLGTLKGSLLEGFFPAGWDLAKIDACCRNPPQTIKDRQPHWNPSFSPVACHSITDFDVMMGHEIAFQIKKSREAGELMALILPVGPMGMYRWATFFLTDWRIPCDHVFGFNMDEWSDGEGNTLDPRDPGSFENAMNQAFYGPLGDFTVPGPQRNFATRTNRPTYSEKVANLKSKGARLVTVFGIRRMFHIAFWEPHFAAEYASDEDWRKATYRLGARLHPLTIEQNAITSFKSRTTLVPCRANTIGPGLFLESDWVIGGCDGALGRGMQWQGASLWVTLRYGPDRWIPSSYMPTLPGKLFYVQELAGPLESECN
jgi:glucosamine-6-phosphate deaminase